ncbi:MAG: FGGY family carbohydrate kinase [Eubacteriales bacterium]|nr:FGGY family carbohydrate kinase [Eubacteriales bacterium]
MKLIGIDIGTTTISAVVLDEEKEIVLDSRTISNDSFIVTDHEWERIQNVEVIIEKAQGVLDELLGLYPEVESVGLTGQMHGILYVDQQGNSVSPLYTWQDQRGNLPEFEGKTVVDFAKERCGITVFTGYGLVTHLYHVKKHAVPKQAVSLCTIPDYLGMRLTGREKPLLHVSMAASLGFFQGEKGSFAEEKMRQTGMDISFLPEVTSKIAVLGTYKGRKVTVAVGDNQASFLGAVGLEKNTLLVNVGTGAQISVLSDYFYESGRIEARPLTGGKFILVGASLCGGRAYAILEKFFREYTRLTGSEECSQYDIMEKIGWESYGKTDSMTAKTTFNGTRILPELRGNIGNLSEDNFTPGGMVCAVLGGIARELYDMFSEIQKQTGIEAKQIIASGNGIRKNALLQQIFKDMFGLCLGLARFEEEAACGAAISSTYFIS